MSLLLDALKKAAEQKAEKSKQELPQAGSSDETVIDAAAEDVSALEGGVGDGLQQPSRTMQDETEIDDSDFNTRLEQTLLEREDGSETRLEIPDSTETETPSLSAQMQTGEDETIIFAEEDVADFMGEPELIHREPRSYEDETDLSQLAPREDETVVSEVVAQDSGDETDLSQLAAREDETVVSEVVAQDSGDETDLSQLAAREDETVVSEVVAQDSGDETDLSQLAPREDETAVGEAAARDSSDETDLSQLAPREDETDVGELAPQVVADETDLSQLAPREDDTDISEPFPLTQASEPEQQAVAEDETDISVPPASVADLEHAAAQQAAADADPSLFAEPEDITDAGDEDMSLLLVERDQTNLTNPTNLTTPTSATDPQMPQEQIQALQDGSEADDGLALVDTTRHQIPSEAAASSETQTSATATTGIAMDTQTGANTRTSTTATRTYAPDNYDRTLMRLPSDDASKLFAGMKSDSDVVMTPEYAKKVFHSKSSAQRLQHYKFYSGIAVVILLTIAIYGLFEYQDQSATIDASLRPLKRDPMPGIIRPEKESASDKLFAGVEVDERTIDLIESADEAADEVVADTGVIAEDSTPKSTVEVAAVDSAEQTETIVEPEMTAQTTAAAMSTSSQDEKVSEAPSQASDVTSATAGDDSSSSTEVASLAQPAAANSAADPSSSTLKISSSERVEQKSIWLREAYAAYQAGNDELAMSLYNKVLEVDPQNRNALLARAAIHVQNNNSRDAIRDYQTLLHANPKDSLAMASLLAVANYSPQATETQLKLMIRDEPDSPYLNFALANAFGAQNRWQEAQGYYFKALENNPGDPNYAYNLAVSLEHIAQPRAAISYYRRALDNFGNGLATFSRELVDQRLELLGKQ